jgi:flagellar biosynthetic protein FlhB
MHAPIVRSLGRNHFAQLLKRKASLLAIPVIADPPLARALFKSSTQGAAIDAEHFHAVARHYTKLGRTAHDAAARDLKPEPVQ